MSTVSLQPECTSCAALCCMALPFDKSDMFAFDKPGGEGCKHLGPDHACTIHASLETRGFKGCVLFNCYGAGQRVTQDVFDGRSWRDDPSLINPMSEAFGVMRRIHEMLVLIREARRLPLSAQQLHEATRLEASLGDGVDWTQEALQQFQTGPLAGEVAAFLKSLKPLAEQAGLKK